MNNDIFQGIIILLILIAAIFFFIRYTIRLRKVGSSVMTNVVFGATDQFLNKEKKMAVEMIVEKNAHKKMDEQSSGKIDEDK